MRAKQILPPPGWKLTYILMKIPAWKKREINGTGIVHFEVQDYSPKLRQILCCTLSIVRFVTATHCEFWIIGISLWLFQRWSTVFLISASKVAFWAPKHSLAPKNGPQQRMSKLGGIHYAIVAVAGNGAGYTFPIYRKEFTSAWQLLRGLRKTGSWERIALHSEPSFARLLWSSSVSSNLLMMSGLFTYKKQKNKKKSKYNKMN